jgi:hypothetical protein
MPLNSPTVSYDHCLLHLFQSKPCRLLDRPKWRRAFFSTRSLMKPKQRLECPITAHNYFGIVGIAVHSSARLSVLFPM